MKPSTLRRIFNLWPPFLFSGIRVRELSDDWLYARVELRRHWYNRNFVGTHFGGSLFAMTDPFCMILLMQRLGKGHLVWDQASEIDFVSARREPVFAEFRLDPALVEDIRQRTAHGEKYLHWFDIDVKTASGELVARVRKQVYVRLKKDRRPTSAPASR